MSRKSARESVFKLIYEAEVSGQTNELSVSLVKNNEFDTGSDDPDVTFESLTKDDEAYFDKVFYGINQNKDRLRDTIKKYARSFEYSRLYKVDIAILFVAIYEILFMDDIPYKVSINEAVELAKTYSTEKSASYINGILASVVKNTEGR